MNLKVHYFIEKWQAKIYFLCSIFVSKITNIGKKPKNDYKRILIIKIDEIGDMITALPSFKLLRESYPNAEITLFCKKLVSNVVKNDHCIDIVATAKKQLKGKYDLIIDLRSNWSMLSYVVFHPPKYFLERGKVRMKNKLAGKQKHEVEANIQIMEEVLVLNGFEPQLRLDLAKEDKDFAVQWIDEMGLKNFVVLHAGARRPLKQWLPQNFVYLANVLHQKGFEVVFGGGPEDVAVNELISSKLLFSTVNLAGKCTLMQFAAITAHAKLFVGNDSGPMHLAAAVNIPVLGLFGPSVTETFRPYHSKGRYLHYKLDCNPCDQIHCVRPHDICINRITVKEVELMVDELLAI